MYYAVLDQILFLMKPYGSLEQLSEFHTYPDVGCYNSQTTQEVSQSAGKKPGGHVPDVALAWLLSVIQTFLYMTRIVARHLVVDR